MRLGKGIRQRIRYGSASLGITALVLVAVILLNVVVSVLCNGNLWFIDLTSESMYTLSENAESLLKSTIESVNATRDADDPVKVEIIFCADPDILTSTDTMRYIYYTALEMEKACPDTISVSTRDVWSNPSSVDAFRTNSYSAIYQSNVIVSSGTEFRVYSYKKFYTYDTDGTDSPWAYNGEKTFLQGIIAVTRAESPICALTVNHGEPFATEEGRAEYSEFLKVIESAGYEIMYLDLENDEIPTNCRLIITFDPQTDFVSEFFGGNVSETSKLETFINATYSFMIFVDADTPRLPVLEEYLEEWGIAFERYDSTDLSGESVTANYQLADPGYALDSAGLTIIGQYEEEGLGGALTQDMQDYGGSPKVIFGNAMPITYSATYQLTYSLEDTDNDIGAYTYGYYYKNNWSRNIYDVFRTSAGASAYATQNGERLTDAAGDAIVDPSGNFRLMTITRHSRTIGEGKGYTTVNDASYVCAVGSTDFASNAVLSSNAYGNTDTLLSVLRVIGREIVPVGISFTPLYSAEADEDYYTESGTTAQTVALVLTPALVLAGVGIFVLVRRRVRH